MSRVGAAEDTHFTPPPHPPPPYNPAHTTIPQDPYDSELAPLEHHYRFYYDCLRRPNAKSVTTALRSMLANTMPMPVMCSLR